MVVDVVSMELMSCIASVGFSRAKLPSSLKKPVCTTGTRNPTFRCTKFAKYGNFCTVHFPPSASGNVTSLVSPSDGNFFVLGIFSFWRCLFQRNFFNRFKRVVAEACGCMKERELKSDLLFGANLHSHSERCVPNAPFVA